MFKKALTALTEGYCPEVERVQKLKEAYMNIEITTYLFTSR